MNHRIRNVLEDRDASRQRYDSEKGLSMAKAEASVEELVGMIERGELRLPEMQRQYVWQATDGKANKRRRSQCHAGKCRETSSSVSLRALCGRDHNR